jgi:hypothetical protein
MDPRWLLRMALPLITRKKPLVRPPVLARGASPTSHRGPLPPRYRVGKEHPLRAIAGIWPFGRGRVHVTRDARLLSLADGQGRDVTQSFCGICHSPTYITMQPPLPSATWEAK